MAGLIIFDPEDELAGLSTGDDLAVGTYQDIESDTLYFTDGVSIYAWGDDTAGQMQTYTWKSGEIRLKNPVNLGAALVEAETYQNTSPGGTLYVVGSPAATVMRSSDGVTWETITVTTNCTVHYDIAYGSTIGANGRLVIVGGNGLGKGTYSDDLGETWTAFNTPAESNVKCIAWSPTLELFVIGTDGGNIYRSTDATGWSQSFASEVDSYNDVKWDPVSGLFIAVAADSNVGIINTSPDGINWTRNTDPDLSGINNPDTPNALGLGNGEYAVPSGNPAITPKHAYSTDPDGSWTNSATDPYPLYDLDYSPTLGLWMGTTSNSNGNFVSSSDITGVFTGVANGNATGGAWRTLRWYSAGGFFVFIGSGTGDIIMTSDDGTTFTNQTVPSGADSSTWVRMREISTGTVVTDSITFKLYADDVLKHTQTVTSDEPFRLPGGYLSNIYSVEIESTLPVTRVSVAENIFELSEG